MFTSTRAKIIGFLLGFVIVAGICFAGGFAGGILYDQQVLQANTQKVTVPAGTEKDFQLIVEAWNTIEKYYVDRSAVQNTPLAYGAITGMVDALGDTGHSRFLSPEAVQSENSFTTGQFEGIGAEVQTKNNQTVIVAPIPGSPAEKAGVVPGDIIMQVDGKDVSGQPLESVVKLILGPAGTQVQITLQNPTTHQNRTLTITRARISVNNVSWSMVPGTTIADIQLAGFSSGVTNQLRDALTAAKSQGATGVILDLRNNPGGLLNESIGVTSQFLKSGTVLQEKDAQGKINNINVRPGETPTDLAVVVLINQGTASAAEIVSGALQDAQRATLVGETTFGTGTVLDTFSLPDQSALLLATREWLTPKGRIIWHKGISPDQPITLAPGVPPLYAYQLKDLSASDVQATQDTQFLQALKTLQSGAK
jgi:carboxyl-terminal processing protease